MYVKYKNIKNNEKIRKGVGLIWQGIGIFSTIGGGIYGINVIKDFIWKPKKRNFEIYEEDIIQEAFEIKKKAIKKGIDLDVDEVLNELQKHKNIKQDD